MEESHENCWKMPWIFSEKKKNMCAPKQKKTPEASKTTKPTFCLKVALFL